MENASDVGLDEFEGRTWPALGIRLADFELNACGLYLRQRGFPVDLATENDWSSRRGKEDECDATDFSSQYRRSIVCQNSMYGARNPVVRYPFAVRIHGLTVCGKNCCRGCWTSSNG